MRITRFNKAVVSGVATLVNLLVATMADNAVDMTEKQHFITTIITVAVGVYAVWRVPNAKDTPDA